MYNFKNMLFKMFYVVYKLNKCFVRNCITCWIYITPINSKCNIGLQN